MIELLLLLSALGPCATPDQTTAAGKRDLVDGQPCSVRAFMKYRQVLSAAQLTSMKAASARLIGERLTDAPSARYRWDGSPKPGEYCGAVNSKNKFGGYAGFRPFLVRYTKSPIQVSEVLIDGDDYVATVTISETCTG